VDDELDLAPARGGDLLQEADEVRSRLDVGLRNRGAHVGLHEHRAVRIELVEEPPGFGAQRMEPLRSGVRPEAEPADEPEPGDRDHQDRHRADEVMGRHLQALGLPRPVAPAHEEHVEVQEEAADHEEVQKPAEAHHSAAEVLEMRKDPEGLKEPRGTSPAMAREAAGRRRSRKRSRRG
jgi:hypothetical protein